MDYALHYQKLIHRAEFRSLIGYYETHHAIPKCMGGTNDPSNLIKLTPEEHYIAHQLLVKIFPDEPGLVRAAIGMTASKKVDGYIKNKLYGWLKKRNSIMMSKLSKNNQYRLGIKHTEEIKKKISASLKGRKKPKSMSIKLSKSVSGENNPMYGIPRTNKQKQQQSIRMSGLKNSTADKKIYLFKKNDQVFVGTRYDFYTSHNLDKDSVTKLISGKYKSTYGWKCLGLNEMVDSNARTLQLMFDNAS